MRFFRWLHGWMEGHKKATAIIIGALVQAIPDRYASVDTKRWLLKAAMVFCLGQGAADFGKEKAKIEAAHGAGVVTPTSERVTPRSVPITVGEGP